MLKYKNIIIVIGAAIVILLMYLYFTKAPSDQANLVSSSTTALPNIDGSPLSKTGGDATSGVAKDFLALLLNVRTIKLDDSILSDPAFNSLQDSSIVLTQDGTEGRPNPFAQFGDDALPSPLNNGATTLDTTKTDTTASASTALPDAPAASSDTKSTSPTSPSTDQLHIISITPTSAKVGAKITVTGSGFTKTGNSFFFYSPDTNESASVKNLASADGTKFTVTIPSTLKARTFSTYVINTGGSSNTVDFTILP